MKRRNPAPSASDQGTRASPRHRWRAPSFHLPSWLRENLERSLPFVLGGAFCLGAAAWLALGHSHAMGVRASLWVLLAALGVTIGGGGVALTLVEEPTDEPVPGAGDDYVVVPRAEWEQWQEAGPAEAPPVWDETSEPSVADVTATMADVAAGLALPLGSAPKMPASEQAGASAPSTVEPSEPQPTPPVVPISTPASAQAARPSVEALRPLSSTIPSRRMAPPPATPPPRVAPSVSHPSASPPPPSSRPPPRPIWQEEPIHELESLLATLEEAKSSISSGSPTSPRTEAAEPCAACGGPTQAYSEQRCVVCDRPLCDGCLEQSVAQHRPSVCPSCKSLPAA